MQDRHHILFERLCWNNRPTARKLRATPMLIPLLDRDVHNELHRACPPVPVLGYYALERTFREFECGSTYLQTADNLLSAMQEASLNPRAHRIERDLCRLAIQAVDLQRPYIQTADRPRRLYVA